MAYLYSPPTWKNVVVLEGSNRTYIDTSTTTYRQSGTWYNIQNPGMDAPSLNGVDAVINPDGSSLKLYFPTPTIIPSSLVAELTAFGVGTITTV